jgi:hypothetical protein
MMPDPLRVGDRDLNPFAPMGPGGGMLMEPPRGRILLPDRDFPGPGMLPRLICLHDKRRTAI